jgi:hypothetical protein
MTGKGVNGRALIKSRSTGSIFSRTVDAARAGGAVGISANASTMNTQLMPIKR